jgi:uncharacterized integral membrane protein
MKLLYTFGYLLCSVITLYLASRQQAAAFGELKEGSQVSQKKYYFLTLLILIVGFLQFWLLTRFWSFPLVIVLILAYSSGYLIYTVIGAVTGFALPEKRKKISALTLIWNAQNPLTACVLLIFGVLLFFVETIGSIWVFWTNPMGSPLAIVQLAFLNFVLPQVVFIPFLIILAWPIVTSAYLDDDYRNSHIAGTFSFIIYSTIYLLFPIWLFQNEIFEIYGWSLPPAWILLSIPLVIFIVGSIIPFFVGVYGYRSQAKVLISWRINWLNKLDQIVKLPMAKSKEVEINDRFDEIDQEMEKRVSNNKLLQFYVDLTLADKSNHYTPPPTLEIPEQVIEQTPLQAEESGQIIPSPVNQVHIRKSIRGTRNFLKGQYLKGQSGQLPIQSKGYDIKYIERVIKENQKNLINWDIRFDHLWRLLQLAEISLDAKTKDISDFLKKRIEENNRLISNLSSRKNIITGTTLSLASSLIVWVFKAYESEILEFIKRLVQF